MDLTSPRRSSRNHASTLALDVAMSVTSSLNEEPEGRKGVRDSSASSTTSKRSSAKTEEKKKETRGKRRAGMPSSDGKKRRRKRSETEEEESSEEEDELEAPVEEKPKPNDFSVSRLIGEEEEAKRRLDLPDDDALPFPASVLFCDDALGKVDASQYPPNCTQFNIGGTKYLPLSCLMDDDGFTVSITEQVTYTKTNGKKHSASLSEALKNSGLNVKRRILGKELLHVLRIAGLVVHWSFVGQLNPELLKKLQQERDHARKAHESMLAQYAQLQNQTAIVASEEVVKKTVAELIEERKRRSGQSNEKTGGGGGLLSGISFTGSAARASSSPPPSSSTIFPSRDCSQSSVGLEALARAAALQRGENMTVAELMMQQLQMHGRREQQYDHPSGSSGIPLRISDPEHLNKFIGLLNGEKEGSPLAQPTGLTSYEHTFANFDHVPNLSVTEKILLISDFDGGIPEHQLAIKYRVPIEKIPGIIRLRVPLIREQTRLFMEKRRSMRVKALPVRRTNFAGLNIMMWRFFKDCRDRGIALTGRQLKEHAMTIASQLGLTNFKGSEGWLDAFKRRHKIDLRTMTGEAVNYESDPDGNIVCTSVDGADDDDGSYDETTRSSSSPTAGDNLTDQLLASVTAIVNNEMPVQLMMGGGGLEEERTEGMMRAGAGLGTSGLQAFQANYEDPRMAPDFRIDESSLITNIIRSTAVFVPNPEVARALDTLRAYIVTHDPAAIGFFVDLQTRLASTIGAHQSLEGCASILMGAESLLNGGGGVGLLNGVGGMNDQADDQKMPAMVDGEPKEESAESSETSGDKMEEKENEEKEEEKPEEMAVASENGAVNSSHDSTTSEDSNDD